MNLTNYFLFVLHFCAISFHKCTKCTIQMLYKNDLYKMAWRLCLLLVKFIENVTCKYFSLIFAYCMLVIRCFIFPIHQKQKLFTFFFHWPTKQCVMLENNSTLWTEIVLKSIPMPYGKKKNATLKNSVQKNILLTLRSQFAPIEIQQVMDFQVPWLIEILDLCWRFHSTIFRPFVFCFSTWL